MYNLIDCQNCKHSQELILNHIDGTTCIYLCHNPDSREYGMVHAYFYECRMKEDHLKTDERH